jgi:Calx-beta domain/Hydrazine synthase alpha subunit middle domain
VDFQKRFKASLMMKISFVTVLAALSFFGQAWAAAPQNAVMYVTQTPMPDEVLTHNVTETKMSIASTMQSPLGDTAHAARGGALWIRYANGTRRNLTAAAGYGGAVDGNGNATGFQGANSIAVHRPTMHWSGTKAIFSMVVGAPASASDATVLHWQLYEITNFGAGQTPVISYVSGQPSSYDNIEACYDTQDRIIFVSDAPRNMQSQLFPQLDEYMNVATNTGLWRLNRANANELKHILHTPSGAFCPLIDSDGRVLFVQWDHLTRDVSAVYDRVPNTAIGETWTQTFNGNGTFASEASNAAFTLGTTANFASFNNYPEPRNFDKTSLNALVNVNGNAINQFFPWECREDGSSHEIINHIGRHEFGGSNLRKSFTDDPNLVDPVFTQTTALDMLHLIESPVSHGTFYAVNPPELGTHMAGPMIRFNGGITVNPSAMQITQVTPNVFVPNTALGQTALTTAVDIYRNPLPLSDGNLMAVHAAVKQYDTNNGADAQHPLSRYDFKLKMLTASGANMIPDTSITLTTEPNVSLSYYSNGTLVSYGGAPLWELDPVEVVARTAPAALSSSIASIEQTVFTEEGVDVPTFQNYLRNRSLALVVNRNSTRRDSADKQQPFNLKVSWSTTQTLGASGKIYDIGWVQIFQADAIRGFTLSSNPNALPQAGRRAMPVPLHDTTAEMPTVQGAPTGAVKIGDDGSWAAVLPANRALTWHMVNGAGSQSQVKERYWVSFAPGEVRTCAACHGVNTQDQAGNLGGPTNKPNALRNLLQFWKGNNPPGSMQHAAATSNALKNAGSVTLQVKRSGGSVGPVSVNYATANGSALAGTDFTATSGTLNWADGDTADKAITIALLNPATIGGSKTFSVDLSSPVNGSLGATTRTTLSIDETPFNSWLYTNLGATSNTALGAPDADADNDGLANLTEYALGSQPGNPSSAIKPVANLNGSHLELSFTRVRSDVTYTVEVSDDLINWTSGSTYSTSGSSPNTSSTTDVTPASQPAGFTVVRDNSSTTGASHRFMRLRITMP